MLARSLDDSYDVEVRRAVTPLTVAKVSANSAYRFAPPFIATIATGLDVSLTTLGAAIAFGDLVGLTAPLLTRLARRVTRRTAICTGLLGVAAAATVCATSRGAPQFAVGLAMLTIGKIIFDLGIIAWITDRVPYARLGRVIGLTELAWAGSLFIGVVLMGLVTGATSWRWGYAVAVVATVVLATVLRARLPDEQRPHPAAPPARKHRSRLGAGWWVIVGTSALTAAGQAIFVTFGKWLEDDFGLTPTKLAMVIFGLGGAELFASGMTVRFADQWGKQRSTMYAASIIVPAGLGLALFNGVLPLGLALLAVYIAAFEFTIVTTLSLASSLVPAHPTEGLGFMVGAGTLGRALMAAPATAAFTHFGMWLPAVLGASCAAVTVACQWRFRVTRQTS